MIKNFITILISIFFLSCEKEIIYITPEQTEIPLELMNSKEIEMINIINNHIISLNLQPYKTSLALFYLAKDKSYQMKQDSILSHSEFQTRNVLSNALYFGESVSSHYITPYGNVQAYLTSEDHEPMFTSKVYEYIAISDESNWNTVLVARYKPYR